MKKTGFPLLRIVLLFQLVFFAGWWGWMVVAEKNATTVWLETRPVDPRDWISGHYVALSYAFANPSEAALPKNTPTSADSTAVWMQLALSTDTINTTAGPVNPYRAVGYQYETPLSGGLWVKATTQQSQQSWMWDQRLHFGIERFYLGENNPLRNARSGDVVARAIVRSDGTILLKELVEIKKK